MPYMSSLRAYVGSLFSKALWRAVLALAALLTLFVLLTRISHTQTPVVGQSPEDIVPFDHSNEAVDWSRFAYCQYATNLDYLCNSLMIFESLSRLDSKAERLMMYPSEWDTHLNGRVVENELLLKARTQYNVSLVPVRVQHLEGESTWEDSLTKLLAFNQTQYDRILSLDSDATILSVRESGLDITAIYID
jgi:alpha-N-acetylglucosamine transferase